VRACAERDGAGGEGERVAQQRESAANGGEPTGKGRRVGRAADVEGAAPLAVQAATAHEGARGNIELQVEFQHRIRIRFDLLREQLSALAVDLYNVEPRYVRWQALGNAPLRPVDSHLPGQSRRVDRAGQPQLPVRRTGQLVAPYDLEVREV